MNESTFFLTSIAILLLIGLITTWISKKLNISNILLLSIIGVILGFIAPNNAEIFGSTFLITIAILALVMVVFDGASRFQLRKVDQYSLQSIKLIFSFAFLNATILSLATAYLFFGNLTWEIFLLCSIFGIIVSGTDPGSVFSMLKGKTYNVIQFLEIEAILNTPFIVIFPLFILSFITGFNEVSFLDAIVSQSLGLLQQIVAGVGAGVLVGIILLKIMNKVYSQQFSPVGIITAALLAYVLAENLQGNGILAVATLGMVFGNNIVKNKDILQEFNSSLSTILILLVFLLMGFLVEITPSIMFFLKGLIIFGVMLACRFIAVLFAMRTSTFSYREKIFMTLSIPKGIAVAVVAFSLSVLSVDATGVLSVLVQLIVLQVVYSLVCSTIVDRFIPYFVHKDETTTAVKKT